MEKKESMNASEMAQKSLRNVLLHLPGGIKKKKKKEGGAKQSFP